MWSVDCVINAVWNKNQAGTHFVVHSNVAGEEGPASTATQCASTLLVSEYTQSMSCIHWSTHVYSSAFCRHQRNTGPTKSDYICLWWYRHTGQLRPPLPLNTEEWPLLIVLLVIITDAVVRQDLSFISNCIQLHCDTCFPYALYMLLTVARRS